MGQPAGRWSYLKLVEAAASVWHGVRGTRAVFDAEWPPRLGAFWAGIKRSCVHASAEESPLLLALMDSVCVSAAAGLARLRQAVPGAEHPSVGRGLGCFLKMPSRCAPPHRCRSPFLA